MLSTGEITSKPLNQSETRAAKHFLYEVYTEELGWIPEPGNPSQWVVLEDSEGAYLDDMFNRSAHWFGVFDGPRFAASGRLFFPVKSKLEIELYDTIPCEFRGHGKIRAEMNRIAIAETYNGTAVPALLFIEIISFARKKGIDYLFTAAPEKTVDIISMLDFQILHQFKYHQNDTHPAYCAVFDVNDDAKVQRVIRSLETAKITIRF